MSELKKKMLKTDKNQTFLVAGGGAVASLIAPHWWGLMLLSHLYFFKFKGLRLRFMSFYLIFRTVQDEIHFLDYDIVHGCRLHASLLC